MIKIPERIKQIVNTTDYRFDTIGKSDSSVLFLDDKVLKIEKVCEESCHESQIMEWLKGKLPVPEVLCHEKQDGINYLLMSGMPGVMSCDESYMRNPEQLINALAEGLKMLWRVDISDCTYDCGADRRLQTAAYRVKHGLVDMDDAEPDTFGKDGFKNPEDLLNWLIQNKPEEEYVLSHGDYCLPNIFVKDGKISGYVDLGKTGLADRYQDIALCYRSLKHNYEGKYGGGTYEGFDPDLLFHKLGLEPDWNKIKYYILLDELF